MQGYIQLSPDAPMSLADFDCPICYDVVDCPVEMPCGKLACTDCVVEWVLLASGVSCPCCFDDTPLLDQSCFHPLPSIVLKLISSLVVICGKCGERVRAANHREHLSSECKLHTLVQPEASQSPPQITLDAVLSAAGCTTNGDGDQGGIQHHPPYSTPLTGASCLCTNGWKG